MLYKWKSLWATAVRIDIVKLIMLIVLLFSVKITFSQYFIRDSIPKHFLIDSVYTTNTLVVDTILYKSLNHAISLIDSFNVQKDSTWLHFAIGINSFFNTNSEKSIEVFLQQGNKEAIGNQLIQIPGHEMILQGAFFYRSYTFFVYSDDEGTALSNKLFKKSTLFQFNTYYGKVFYFSRLDKHIDFPARIGLKLFYKSKKINYGYTIRYDD